MEKSLNNKIMLTIAQQLKIKEFPFSIKDSEGKVIYFENSDSCWYKCEYDSNSKEIYCENSDGYWIKREYDSNGKEIYCENSDGYWYKLEYDSKGNQIYFENSDGYWRKSEYDFKGNMIYFETSDGELIDKRPKSEVQKAIELLTKEGLIVDGKILR
jgi:hypothetical protein